MDCYCCYTDKELHTFKYVAFVVPQPPTPTNEEHRAFFDDERDEYTQYSPDWKWAQALPEQCIGSGEHDRFEP
jgi:hypothetical protein